MLRHTTASKANYRVESWGEPLNSLPQTLGRLTYGALGLKQPRWQFASD